MLGGFAFDLPREAAWKFRSKQIRRMLLKDVIDKLSWAKRRKGRNPDAPFKRED
jgi:hypothetical protein